MHCGIVGSIAKALSQHSVGIVEPALFLECDAEIVLRLNRIRPQKRGRGKTPQPSAIQIYLGRLLQAKLRDRRSVVARSPGDRHRRPIPFP